MSRGTVDHGGRYWAFISYSHKDAAFGRRLHRRLEGYSLPRRLIGQVSANGDAVPARLVPIFRDREEFSAARDLSAEVQGALAESRSLIVVCSPSAAASTWVAREVELFRQLHPDRPVLAAIRDGQPADSMPAALRMENASGEIVEPLAADFRSEGDGETLAMLKLVAGIAGLRLDELVGRDAQRRFRRVTAVTASALALVLAMGVLTLLAMNARSEAERQRVEAEGLVEFMLTDLRTTLKGVGRLDAMTAVNQRALKYYGDQDLSRLPPDSLERRARIFHAMGEDDETRGNHDAALEAFREARRTTAALLDANSADPERIFEQAQSEYWFGFVDYNRGRTVSALPAFEEYKRLTDRLVAIDPHNPKYQREAGYAEGTFCAIALVPPEHPAEAMRACSAALSHMEAAAKFLDAKSGIANDLVNRHAWLADAYVARGDPARARTERLAEERLLDPLIKSDPNNMDLKDTWVSLQRAFARLDILKGQKHTALERLANALAVLKAMISFDPTNQAWVAQRDRIQATLAHLKLNPTTTHGGTP